MHIFSLFDPVSMQDITLHRSTALAANFMPWTPSHSIGNLTNSIPMPLFLLFLAGNLISQAIHIGIV